MHYKKFNLEKYQQEMKEMIGSGPETSLFLEALDFAYNAHEGQMRKSGEPYIMHPCYTAQILAQELDIHNPEILAAALLHDTIEDVDYVTQELIQEKFGTNVAVIVDGCTKVKHPGTDKQTFKKNVHRKLFTGAAARPEVMLVKLADRLHNLRTLGSMPNHKRQRIAEETLDFYAPLATILGMYNIKRELYTLALTYKFPRQRNNISRQIIKLKEDPCANELVTEVQWAMNEAKVEGKASLRTKGLWGYFDAKNKVLRQELEIAQEILILVDKRSCCYRALGALNKLYPPIPRTIRDFIANPKQTGYQGLHAKTIIDGRKFLFKIRTEEMARRAQRGLVRDWKPTGKNKGRFVNEIQEMFDILGSDKTLSYRDMIAAGGRKEIYAHTPQGDLHYLPVGSIVLDFAFRIHTDIGHTCTGALIGNHRAKPTDKLKDGDVVKITRQGTPVHFSPDVQPLCQTPKARSELTKAFNQRREPVLGRIGKSVLQQEMLRYGLPYDLLEKPGMADILTYFQLESMDDLLKKIGQGQLRIRELIYEISQGLYVGEDLLDTPTGIFNRIELTTVDPVVVRSSNCCKPTPVDRGIMGLLSERGISLHSKTCPQLGQLKFQREDAVEVRWKQRITRVEKTQKIIIMATSRNRLFSWLSVAPEELCLSEIQRLSRKKTRNTDWEVYFTVNNLYGLKKIIRHLERYDDIQYGFDFEQ